MEVPLVDKDYLLERTPGNGGWTYAPIPEVPQDKKAPFGWVKVKGSIDGVEIKKHHLMPMGNGELGLSVKAEIRKKIKKQAGDYVHVVLYLDEEPSEIPEELQLCLQDEPRALEFFNSLAENELRQLCEMDLFCKDRSGKSSQDGKAIDRLASNLKYYDKG